MSRYFYLDVDLGAEESALGVRRLVEEAVGRVFGSSGAAAVQVDVLRAEGERALLRVPARELRRLRAALALSPRRLLVKGEAPSLQAKMATRSVLSSGPEGKDLIIIAPREELAVPSTVSLPEPEPAPGLIMPDGSINWGCPCLGGMATGPCGVQFRDAFSCFHYSDAEPKGSDCYEKFSIMQDCMAKFPELYGKDDDDELAAALAGEGGAGEGGPGERGAGERGAGDN